MSSSIDIADIRSDLPSGWNKKLFFNSAGASLMPRQVLHRIKWYLDEESRLGGYKAADIHYEAIQDFYRQIAGLIGAQPDNIAFSSNATEAYIKALSSIRFREGDVIITTDDDYASNQIQFLALRKRFGIIIKRIATKANGDLDIADLERLIDEKKPKLVAVTHVPTNSGLIQNVAPIGEICNKEDIIYLVDACQSVGQLKVDVQKVKCDFLSATGRKFLRGPRGTGFLYVSDRLLDRGSTPLFVDGAGAEWQSEEAYKVINRGRRFETWEKPAALMLGLTEALIYLDHIGIERVERRNNMLLDRLRSGLNTIPGVHQYDNGTQKASIVTFRKNGRTVAEISAALNDQQVYHSVSNLEWGLIDFTKKGVDGVIRLSPHYFNTEEETDRLIEIIQRL